MRRLLYDLLLAYLFLFGTSTATAEVTITHFHIEISGSPMRGSSALLTKIVPENSTAPLPSSIHSVMNESEMLMQSNVSGQTQLLLEDI